MFAEWVAIGVAFGVKAFFAVFIFGLLALLLLGLLGIISSIAKWLGDGNEPRI